MANWYAVYTRPRLEKKVAESFLKKEWESYCPLRKAEERSWTGQKSAVALFPSYVFVRVAEAKLAQVKKTDGVINLVYWLDAPVKVRDVEIEMIRRFLNVHKTVRTEQTAIRPRAMVRLAEALPMEGADGQAASSVEVRLFLPSLGHVLVAVAGFHKQHHRRTEPFMPNKQLHTANQMQ